MKKRERQEEEEVDALSYCIQLTFAQHPLAVFRPPFTHQFFENKDEMRTNFNLEYNTTDLSHQLTYDQSKQEQTTVPNTLLSTQHTLAFDADTLGHHIRSYSHDGSECLVRVGAIHESASRREFNDKLQTLFRFYIECHSYIDSSDDRWLLFTSFQRTPNGLQHFVGAATVYCFSRWAPGAGEQIVLKVCQVLVLPTHQSQGHGGELLRAAYDYAERRGAVEVTVEDPSEGFTLMRDVTDMRRCIDLGLCWTSPIQSSSDVAHALGSDESWEKARSRLRLTKEQAVRCREALAYISVYSKGAPCDEIMRSYRLCVKRRLARSGNFSVVAGVGERDSSGEARKAALEGAFQTLCFEYSALARVLVQRK